MDRFFYPYINIIKHPSHLLAYVIIYIVGFGISYSALAQNSNPDHLSTEIFTVGTVNSFIVEVNGKRIIEEYTDGMHAGRTTNTKSASKSILSLLIGIAIEEGYLDGIDQPIGEFFPEFFETNPDPVKESITIEDLLTMRAGLETTSFRNYGRWVLSNNWVEFALSQPLEEEPGGRMVYSTGTSHLLSVILTRASGMSTREFASRYLFGPLGITVGGWDRDPQGYYMGGNNLALSPSAMLKIGRLVMNTGEYEGQQIVPEEWIIDSMRVYTRSNYNPYDYGYMWWQRKLQGYHIFFAWGNGGQYILMLPELNSIVVITSDVERSNGSRRHQRQIFSFVENKLIPFLEEKV